MKCLALYLLMAGLMSLPASAETTPLKVVTTFSILGDLAKNVGGSLVEVKALVGPDGDAHTYKPTPNDARALSQADLVLENGLGLEGWLDRLIPASGYKGAVTVASKGVAPRLPKPDEGLEGMAVDPHAWQNIANARIYVRNIAAAFDKALPGQASVFDANARAYDAELRKLDAWVRTQIGEVPAGERKIIASHDAFGYFGAAYGVTFMAPQGLSTEVEPTATQVGRLVEQIKTEKIRRVFFENMASSKLVAQLAKDAGATVGEPLYSDALSPPAGLAPTYIAMFRYNVPRLKEAMLLNGR